MYNIYYGKRCICVESAQSQPPALECVHSLTESFLKENGPSKLIIRTEDPQTLYQSICEEFHQVTAAGGLVVNDRGEYLIIERNGLWDLPKGHLEEGEQTEQTALREVNEETGLSGLELGKLICVTHHCYPYSDQMRLKHTWWYEMRHHGCATTKPQNEENITNAVWMTVNEISEAIKKTYPSIIEVLKSGISETF